MGRQSYLSNPLREALEKEGTLPSLSEEAKGSEKTEEANDEPTLFPSYFNDDSIYSIENDQNPTTNFLKILTVFVALYCMFVPGSMSILFYDMYDASFVSATMKVGLDTSPNYGDDLSADADATIQQLVEGSDDGGGVNDVWFHGRKAVTASIYAYPMALFGGFFVLANGANNIVPALEHILDDRNFGGFYFGNLTLLVPSLLAATANAIYVARNVWSFGNVHMIWILTSIPAFHVVLCVIALFYGNPKFYFQMHFQAVIAFEFTNAFFAGYLACYTVFYGNNVQLAVIIDYITIASVIITSLDENMASLLELLAVGKHVIQISVGEVTRRLGNTADFGLSRQERSSSADSPTLSEYGFHRRERHSGLDIEPSSPRSPTLSEYGFHTHHHHRHHHDHAGSAELGNANPMRVNTGHAQHIFEKRLAGLTDELASYKESTDKQVAELREELTKYKLGSELLLSTVESHFKKPKGQGTLQQNGGLKAMLKASADDVHGEIWAGYPAAKCIKRLESRVEKVRSAKEEEEEVPSAQAEGTEFDIPDNISI